jgi:hypothetical protein
VRPTAAETIAATLQSTAADGENDSVELPSMKLFSIMQRLVGKVILQSGTHPLPIFWIFAYYNELSHILGPILSHILMF